MSSIENHPSGEKFHLMSTVWFILWGRFIAWQQRVFPFVWSWQSFCYTLFEFNPDDICWDNAKYQLTCPLTTYEENGHPFGAIYGNITETKRLVPEPVLSHRLAHVAISCMHYLCRRDPTQNHLLAWAKKSKQSPWLWRHRLEGISARRGYCWSGEWVLWSFPQSLHRLRQALYATRIQSEKFYQLQHIFYIWALDLLYHTLSKAMKSDELVKALSKSFIPSSAALLFPRRVKRVREMVNEYLGRVSRRAL